MFSLFQKKRHRIRHDFFVKSMADHLLALKDEGYEKVIIVNGYPKSGNSWLCKILAYTLNCSVAGYLGAPHATEISKTVMHGNSSICILKSHHVPHHFNYCDDNFVKVLHIVRDPRDVCVSAAAYFHKRAFKNKFFRFYALIKQMFLLVRNKPEFPTWWSAGWSGYYSWLLDDLSHVVRYEDLLDNKQDVLLDFFAQHIGDVSPERLTQSMRENSFSAMKKKDDAMSGDFLRSGTRGSYKRSMPIFITLIIERYTAIVRKAMGYD
jgi:hypothetical protein